MLAKRTFCLHIPCLTQTSEEYISYAGAFFGNRTNEALQLYPRSTYIQANDSANALAGDLVIRQQTWEALDRHVRVGGQKGYWLLLYIQFSLFSVGYAYRRNELYLW